ncbi:bifunctional DNA-formamidopyrimidine glycosylase/DNA-(apurinic or apyrimidinic site) lyase [Ideonella livida]|uniref:Formamidopyrimidine-DNA glycosylase n=1 Tax=Ideonella livida TaxID=2707176 RepID=A0A7C9TLF6_9BURK|nr:bifunctional DNA-formamidopyrimidine glycosylase/DNA-(apurinic or apyrimidinic site) lyase [Ideonella livida]NDY92263.1 bifunctional DNA-formamidopyrimidine glycosylase/DNA-(apurinic or apyrimidinic site) lyase [Ideonella livida]
MPELPEVEVTRQRLQPVEGATIQCLTLGKPLRWPLGCEPADLVGCRIGALLRRGKYLWMPLSRQGAPAGGLLWHLGMSGALSWLVPPLPAGPHDHADLHTDRGLLRLTDPRRFGALVWGPAWEAPPVAGMLARLGPEPWDPTLTTARFHAALQGRRVAIKPLLLSGTVVVGVGNIYASDALFEAGIDPRTPAAHVGQAGAARLLESVRRVLSEAIAAGGSSLKDFHGPDGALGHYQRTARVYGRAGEACSRCGGGIQRLVQGQRATYFCPGCQHP